MTLFHISRTSNANNNSVPTVEIPKEKKPSSSLLKLTGNAFEDASVSYQVHSATEEVLNAGAIENADDARTKLTEIEKRIKSGEADRLRWEELFKKPKKKTMADISEEYIKHSLNKKTMGDIMTRSKT
jgi:hypothetical protein